MHFIELSAKGVPWDTPNIQIIAMAIDYSLQSDGGKTLLPDHTYLCPITGEAELVPDWMLPPSLLTSKVLEGPLHGTGGERQLSISPRYKP